MKLIVLLGMTLISASCSDIPKDPDGTLERVRAEHRYKVGLIASGAPVGTGEQRLFLANISRLTGAQPDFETGPAEPLLVKLEEGKLDLVIGPMAAHSPWTTRVTFLPLLGEQVTREGHVHVAAMTKNGENRWISLLSGQATEARAAR